MCYLDRVHRPGAATDGGIIISREKLHRWKKNLLQCQLIYYEPHLKSNWTGLQMYVTEWSKILRIRYVIEFRSQPGGRCSD
jgi:hypothetical protein